MTAAGSSSFGQRCVQVRQPAQLQRAAQREELLFGRRISDLDQAHDLVRHQVHVPGHRAAGGAFAALVTAGDVHAVASRMDRARVGG